MMEQQVKRRVMVVDDTQFELDLISDFFALHKANNFNNWNITDPKILEVLSSIELEMRRNDDNAENMSPILDEVVKSSNSTQQQPLSGIISDMGMYTGQEYKESRHTPDPQNPDKSFFENRTAVGIREGGAQLAKVANLLHIPVVIFSGGGNASGIIATKHLKNLKPAKAEVYDKGDYKGIFVGLAKQIIENEKEQGASIGR